MLSDDETLKPPTWMFTTLSVTALLLILFSVVFVAMKYCQDHYVEINGIPLYRAEIQ